MTATNTQNFLNSINSFSEQAERLNQRGQRAQADAEILRNEAIRKGKDLAQTANVKAFEKYQEYQKKLDTARQIGEGLIGFAGLPAVKAGYGLAKAGLKRLGGKAVETKEIRGADDQEIPQETEQDFGAQDAEGLESTEITGANLAPETAEAEADAPIDDLGQSVLDLFGPGGEIEMNAAANLQYSAAREGNMAVESSAEDGLATAPEAGTELETMGLADASPASELPAASLEAEAVETYPAEVPLARGTVAEPVETFAVQDAGLDSALDNDGGLPPPEEIPETGYDAAGEAGSSAQHAAEPVVQESAQTEAAANEADVSIAGQADESGAALAEGVYPTVLPGGAAEGEAAAGEDLAEGLTTDAILEGGAEAAAEGSVGGPEVTVAVLAATAIAAGLFELFGGGQKREKKPDPKPPPPVPKLNEDTRALGRASTIVAPSENTAAHQSQAQSVF